MPMGTYCIVADLPPGRDSRDCAAFHEALLRLGSPYQQSVTLYFLRTRRPEREVRTAISDFVRHEPVFDAVMVIAVPGGAGSVVTYGASFVELRGWLALIEEDDGTVM